MVKGDPILSVAELSRIKAACTCGKKYVVRAEVAGKKIRCTCGEVFSVPTAEEVPQATPEKMCPWCDAGITEDQEACEKCETEAATETLQVESETTHSASEIRSQIVFTSAICLPVVFGVSLYQFQLKGPEFLKLYFCVGVVCFIACLIVRFAKFSIALLVVLVLSYEAIGAIRYGYGLSQGMRNFGFLTQMMLFGPIAFIAAVSEGSGGSGGSSWGGGGCGGGGCGGGGCGGCGG